MHRRHRLRKSADFQRVRAIKQSWAHPLLVLYAAPNDLGVTRVGVSVGKRIGKAVARNRMKRLIRETVRQYLPDVSPGHDLVFIARPAAANATFEQVNRAVEMLLRRARMLPRRQHTSGERGHAGREPRPLSSTPPEGSQTGDEMDSAVSD